MNNRKLAILITLIVSPMILSNTVNPARSQENKTVNVLKIEGEINNHKESIITKFIDKSNQESHKAMIILLNTLGGSGKSMMNIIEDIKKSKTPIITYVHPQGGRASSAGTYIAMSSDLIAMSPSTSIGACEPILGYDSSGQIIKAPEKIRNFYASYMRSLAEESGRNITIAEKFVTENLSLTTEEALQLGVSDLKASSLEELIKKADDLKTVGNDPTTLNLENAQIENFEKSLSDRVLEVITEPTINYLLFILGIFGLVFGFLSPGWYLPETFGTIALLLAIIGYGYISFQIVGLIFIFISILFFYAELETSTFGFFTAAGLISFFFGSMFLFRGSEDLKRFVSREWYINFRYLVITISILTGAFFVFGVAKIIESKKLKVATGSEQMIGMKGIANEDLDPFGKVKIHGEIWKAKPENGKHIKKHSEVKVIDRDELTLIVKKINS